MYCSQNFLSLQGKTTFLKKTTSIQPVWHFQTPLWANYRRLKRLQAQQHFDIALIMLGAENSIKRNVASLENSRNSFFTAIALVFMARRDRKIKRDWFSRQLIALPSKSTPDPRLNPTMYDQSQCFVVLNGWLVGWIQFSMPASRSLNIRKSNESKSAQIKSPLSPHYSKLNHNKL